MNPLSSPNPLPMEKMYPHRRARMTRLPQQGPFRHFIDMKAEKRLAGWKERRSRFGDISVHKCYQFGQIFSPFQALATTVSFYNEISQVLLLSTGQYSSDTVLLSGPNPGNEIQTPNPKELVCFQGNTATNQKSIADAIVEMRRLVLPRDLPISSRKQRISTSSLSDMNLQDLPLPPTELSLGKDDSHHEKEKSVSHMKTPLFPPIVKATKYNDMK